MSDRPTQANLLSPEKQKLFEQLLKQRGIAAPQAQGIPRRAESGACPLSFAQQRLWFFDQLQPNSPAYNDPLAVRLVGPLDLALLVRSVNAIVRRHEILRTTFASVAGQPVQVIAHDHSQALPLLDLRARPAEAREAEARRVAQTEAQRPFDLERGPLMRSALLRLGDDDHVLLLTLHHIITDGWSWGVLFRELAAFYSAGAQGTLASLPALPIQYADYAVWQRDWLQGELRESHLAYWRQQLADLTLLQLPIGRPRPATLSPQGALQTFAIPQPLAEALATLRPAGVTLFMMLLTAFQTLLARYSGQDDIVVGTTIANRARAETEGLIGCFVNTLVLRADLADNPPFREVLKRVREVCLAAYAHQDLPFEQLVEELQPERDLSRNPLFQVAFDLQSGAAPTLKLPGLSARRLEIAHQTAKFELGLSIIETASGLEGGLEYATDLFDAATITRMAGHILTLLQGIVATPERPIADLPLLTAAEQRQLLVDWQAAAFVPQAAAIHELFAAQAARTPDAIALVYETKDEGRKTKGESAPFSLQSPRGYPAFSLQPSAFSLQLTYRELNTRANQLAHYLQRLGAGPEVRVGICMERSLELMIGLLGILKAGAAYVPLDPTYPAERLAFMLEDAQVRLLITARDQDKETKRHGDKEIAQLSVSLSPGLLVSRTVVDLRADWPLIARESARDPLRTVAPEQIAYVIYTSGSTGRPKGAIIPHQALAHYALVIGRRFGLRADDRILQFASLSFDVLVEELFPTWLLGATVVLLAEGPPAPGVEFQQLVDNQRLTGFELPTAYWQEWVYELARTNTRPPRSLRFCIIGGENPLLERITTWQKFNIQLFNVYGLTEVTVTSTVYELPPDTENRDGYREIPIGRPIANAQLFVLDAHMQPAPVGKPAELYIGGIYLGRGYLNRPDLTAARFVPNPFTEVSGAGCQVSEGKLPDTRYPIPGTRLYRTGDLVRYLPDGNIEFFGRIDDQVKLRGYRIELGEIAAVLAQHAQVREAVVLVRTDAPGEQRLVAYVVPAETLNAERRTMNGPEWSSSAFSLQPSALAGELRSFLAARLPTYMVPSHFVVLTALPLLPNGKLDRRALPPPEAGLAQADAIVSRQTPVEELLASIWADVLRLTRVGLHDNFFALGGHSLLATQVIARVRDTFHIEVPLRSMFETPTVAALAEAIETRRRDSDGLLPELRPVPRDSSPPLAFAQQRLWFLDQLEPNNPAYNIGLALRIEQTLDVAALAGSLRMIVARHEMLRTTFVATDGQPVQLIAPAQVLPLPLLDLLALPTTVRESMLRHLAEQEATRPFDLARGPLLRTHLLQLASDMHVLLLTMHHIVADDWSMRVFMQELAAGYQALTTATALTLPELPIQYADYAIWQRAWLHGVVLDAQLAYWQTQLADLTPLALPTDHPRPVTPSFQGASQTFALPDLHRDLLALSRRSGVTLFMTVLAVFQLLLARYSGQDDIVVGTPIANRTQRATEGLIGFFVNTLVLRTDMAGCPSFSALLQRVREVCLGAYAHQELPFEQVVDALQPTRDLSRHPLFQVMFTLDSMPASALTLPGLMVQPLELDWWTVKFDLSMALAETPDGLIGGIEYTTDLFEAATIARMCGHFQTLVAAIVAQPERPLGQLALLTAAEQAQLVAWQATHVAFPPVASVYDLFADQTARTPDAVALIYEANDERQTTNTVGAEYILPLPSSATQLTYHDLLTRANRLAQVLQQHGVGPEVRVGLFLAPSLDLVVGLLGVLAAGGAYVPLDPSYPPARLAFMLTDSQATLLLTQQQLLGALPPHSARLLVLDQPWPDPPSAPLPAVAVAPEQLAYLLYTSGSTGQPKGVLVPQRSLLNLLMVSRQQFGVQPGDLMPALASVAFDIALFELLTPLIAGGSVRLLSREQVRDLPQLLDTLADCTLLHGVPSLLRQLLDALAALGPARPRYRQLRAVFVGGDLVPPSLLTALRATFEAAQVWVLYGPTEATILATRYAVPASGPLHGQPIGVPLPNLVLRLLDRQLQPVPLGVVGELYLGGAGLTRGYHAQPALTAERFIPNPFVGDKETRRQGDKESGHAVAPQSAICNLQSAIGERLYRTGDLARYRADGTLEFLGRRDAQVKLRGYRIELGEIETLLRAHAALQDAVVVARAEPGGEARLVAYVVTTNEMVAVETQNSASVRQVAAERDPSTVHRPSSIVSELRAFLQTRLPDYMIPAVFVPLDALPLTAHGKLDRRALPAPDPTRPAIDAAFVAPHGRAEEVLTQIWAAVLRLDRVGVHDNFFALGGDSILSIQIIARAAQAGLRLTPKHIFQHQTIAELAAIADTTSPHAAEQGIVTGPVPLTPIQQHFFAQDLPDRQHFNQALLLATQQPLDPALLAQVVSQLVQHHDALRLRFIPSESGWRQINLPAERRTILARLDLADLSTAQQAPTIEAAAANVQASLDLTDGPIMRVVLFECGADQPSRLLLVIHHLVVDAVSWGVLLEDLQTAYEQLQCGETVRLPAKTTAFKHWAERLATYAQSDELRRETAHWLATSRQHSHLPRDKQRGANTIASARDMTVALSVEETRALLHDVPPVYQTQINDVLLTALAQAFASWTGARTLLIELEGHGREDLFDDVDLTRTVGWYTTLFPVLLDVRQTDGPGTALKAIKEQLRAIPNRGIGYGLLRYSEDAAISMQLQALPPPEVSFNYLGQNDQAAPVELFGPAAESSGPAQSIRGMRSHLLEVNSSIVGGQLQLMWTYSTAIHEHATIARLADGYLTVLRALIAHCQSSDTGGYTPSDFPEMGFGQGELDDLIALLSESVENHE